MNDATAPPEIPPPLVDGIARGIGESFTFQQLDDVLYRCAGERVILGYTNELLPLWSIARDCLEGAEKDGITVVFLANLLSALPEKSPLYAKIIEAVPDAKNKLPEVRGQMPDLLRGLERTRQMLVVPAVRAIIDRSKKSLQEVKKGVSRLEGYKGLHDCLHMLQLEEVSLLPASSTSITKTSIQSATFKYKELVRTHVETARELAGKLPDPNNVSDENKWIKELDDAAKFLQKSLNDRNPDVANFGVIKISHVLQSQPQRLNGLIIKAAKELPLKSLSAALKELGSSGVSDASDFANADRALLNVDKALRALVAEHDMWQTIDVEIWPLEQIFSLLVDQAGTFTAGWPSMKSKVRSMTDLSPESDWSRDIRKYADDIDTELLRLQSPSAVQQQSSLASLFAQFRGEVRFRFFVVNKQLKHDCTSLVAINTPISSILEVLSHD